MFDLIKQLFMSLKGKKKFVNEGELNKTMKFNY